MRAALRTAGDQRPVLENQGVAFVAEHVRRQQIYENYSQADLIGRATAREFLDTRTNAWAPGDWFTENLTSAEKFNWRLYL